MGILARWTGAVWEEVQAAAAAHKAAHSTGGSDALVASDIGASATGHTHTGTYEPSGTVATHEADSAAAHAASAVAFTPTGTIAATDVQAALAEVDSEKATTGHNHSGTYVALPATPPTGPTQILGLSDDDPLTTDWIDPPSSGIAATLFDAAGDLLTATANDTPSRLAMGTALQVLRVNAGATALEYATPASGASGISLFRSGQYTSQLHTTRATFNLGAGLTGYLFFAPLWVAQTVTIDRLGVEVTTGGSAGSVVRVGIYNNNNGLPGSLLVETSALAATTLGLKEGTISQQLTPGLWWLAAVAQVAGPILRSSTTPSIGLPSPSGFVASATGYNTWVQGGVTGALPNPPTVSTTEMVNNVPLIWMRAA